MPFIVLSIIQTRSIHSFATSFTTVASGMNLNRNTITNFILINSRSKLHNSSHIFMSRSKSLIKWKSSLDQCWWTVLNNLQICCTDCNSIHMDQNLCSLRFRNWFFLKCQFSWISQYPRLHLLRNLVIHMLSSFIFQAFRLYILN